jgi:hypothetical protein
MRTQEFIDTLRRHRDKQLIFASENGTPIHGGYHLTELKAVTLDTVDCGGQLNRWPETLVQLWVPEDAGDDYMSTAKFLSIYDKVAGMIPLQPGAEIRIEYGDENFFPSTYGVEEIDCAEKAIRVTLRPPITTCKARDRRLAGAKSCCS